MSASVPPTVITVSHDEHCSQAIAQTSQGTPHASTHLSQCFYKIYFFCFHDAEEEIGKLSWKPMYQCLHRPQ